MLNEENKKVRPSFEDMVLSSYDYELPEERIAQYPLEDRSASRLMVMDKKGGFVLHSVFSRLAEYLEKGSLLVANNSMVVPARLFGVRPSGGRAEMLLLTPPPVLESASFPFAEGWSCAEAEVLLRPGRSIREGDELLFGDCICATVLGKKDFGMYSVMLRWRGNLVECLRSIGKIPLPPYIKRDTEEGDAARYQTLYARRDMAGSVAAPTAGLHFTRELRHELAVAGFEWAEVTLHVGYGTFSPVREEDIRSHPMHSEYALISPETATAIRRAKKEGRPVVAVGTTSCRTMEGCAESCGGEIPEEGWHGKTDIFIYPGFEFRVTDQLITNFHLPKSSLLMLVSAFCGRKRILEAYKEAVSAGYRFFSYGDAMLIR